MSSIPSSITDLIQDKIENNDRNAVINMSIRPPAIQVDENMPWAKFRMPTSLACDLSMARVKADHDNETMKLLLPDGTEGPLFDHEGLRLLGHATGFKVDFLDKLSLNLRADIINELMRHHRSQVMQFIGDTDKVTEITPGWRDVCSHSEVIQAAYNALHQCFPNTQVSVKDLIETGTGVSCRFVTDQRKPVTKALNDVLSIGVKVKHRYGVELLISLFIERLVCLNGMTRDFESFAWTSRQNGKVTDQLNYVISAINDCGANFDEIVSRAQTMARTEVPGEPRDALISRARAMKIPESYFPDLVSAYEVEAGNSEWSMLNALTRFATHSSIIDDNMRDTIQVGAGRWTYEFDMVNARLPRPVAERVGAQIYEEE